MYNRYQGNSGRVERVPDAPQPSIRPRPPAQVYVVAPFAGAWIEIS